MIKAAQRLGFSLDEVAGLLETGRNPHRGHTGSGLRQRTAVKLAETEAKIADLTVIAGTLRAALDAGCVDLADCARQPQMPAAHSPAWLDLFQIENHAVHAALSEIGDVRRGGLAFG